MMKRKELILVIHNVRSALNVGSMFRTADGAGVSRVYVCGYSPTPEHPKVAKTSLGAEKTVSWEYDAQAWRILQRLKKDGYRILALEQSKKSADLFSFKPRYPIALVVGNEVGGLSPKILSYCDTVLEIPMYGKKESLNVSVAAGIALYALRRK
jgi:23S rRNA (guanosine2251-2'-O)-methyltransferase